MLMKKTRTHRHTWLYALRIKARRMVASSFVRSVSTLDRNPSSRELSFTVFRQSHHHPGVDTTTRGTQQGRTSTTCFHFTPKYIFKY